MYTVAQALADLKRTLLWNEYPVRRAPLVGDPFGRTFRTEFYPLAPGSLSASSLYYEDGTSASSIFQSCDPDTGLVLTTASPVKPLYADFVLVELTDQQLQNIVAAGLDLLESRWPRGWRIDSGAIVDSSGADPTVGDGMTLSTSRAEIGLLLLACEIRLVEARLHHAATTAFSYRGSGGGLAVDKSRQPINLAEALRELKQAFENALRAVANSHEDGSVARFIIPYLSRDYLENFFWQRQAELNPENIMRP